VEASNLVPFTEFATDLGNDQLPVFWFIVPNLLNDARDRSLQQADTWLQQNIAPLISSTAFQKDGLLMIVFDESNNSDLINPWRRPRRPCDRQFSGQTGVSINNLLAAREFLAIDDGSDGNHPTTLELRRPLLPWREFF
jgi:Phosphoesterase family